MASSFNDAFVVISTREEDFSRPTLPTPPVEKLPPGKDPLYKPWLDHGNAKFEDPVGFAVRKLRELHPKASIVPFTWGIDLFGFPRAYLQPISPPELITNAMYFPLARRMGENAGVLVNSVRFGAFSVAWENWDFTFYTMQYLHGPFEQSQNFLLFEGNEEPARALLAAAGSYTQSLHEEIFVFDSGFWQKDHKLWLEVQKANWDDVILKDEFKKGLQKDVFGFFDSEDMYHDLGIPWKRGIIMHGPPGNGKTISMKAIMKQADENNYAPLYVRSFRSWKGDEGAMVDVFEHARRMAPCVVILEDLDSLINPSNRSFFLNQLDGLDSNDGLLVIGTTNHLENIDPSLRNRPSRFDRKFKFDNPDSEERKLYVQYWQHKLSPNKEIDFPESLADEIVDTTDKFSFAFLKEAFVSALVTLAGYEGDKKPTFASEIKEQISALRKQLNNDASDAQGDALSVPGAWTGAASRAPQPDAFARVDRRRFESGSERIWVAGNVDPSRFQRRGGMPGEMPTGGDEEPRDGRDMRSRALHAAALGRSFLF
ncbi:P-loop containing nucleoside triphosphate hydrolase protein [Phanerochaete sordida]|uniref:P-loop containing nucleoside triphosphate hydrolase protein n=1 Tax=Phanerochaete sordida TaxID=48140 RepID=A0A9P3FYP5_9APHY|nr:P-loop containing nucleoside triphosphate hydrolase protein [Phanerochaete sordida]